MRPKKNQSPICKHRWFGYGINSSAKAYSIFLMALAIWGSRSWFAEKRNFVFFGMTNRTSPGFLMVDPSGNSDYPLVNIQTTMENHHFLWENLLFLWPFSIAMLNYQRVIMLHHCQLWCLMAICRGFKFSWIFHCGHSILIHHYQAILTMGFPHLFVCLP